MTAEPDLTALAETADQLAELRHSAATTLSRAWSMARLRATVEADQAYLDADIWEALRSLGWFDLLVSESRGGGGGDVAALCVLAEELGAAGVPVPLGPAAVAAHCEDRTVVGVPLALTAAPSETAVYESTTVSGFWPYVPYGAVATRLLVCVCDREGTSSIVVVSADGTGVERIGLTAMDHAPAASIRLSGTPVLDVVATGVEAQQLWASTQQMGTLALAAELVGVARAAHEAACDYARVRTTFGHPIGSYQAIKHRLVDQRSTIEVARALIQRGADAVARSLPDAGAHVALAAYWAGCTLRAVPEGAIQVFGGIGYTWEHDAHLHLRRAACLTAELGSMTECRQVVMRWLMDEGSRSKD